MITLYIISFVVLIITLVKLYLYSINRKHIEVKVSKRSINIYGWYENNILVSMYLSIGSSIEEVRYSRKILSEELEEKVTKIKQIKRELSKY